VLRSDRFGVVSLCVNLAHGMMGGALALATDVSRWWIAATLVIRLAEWAPLAVDRVAPRCDRDVLFRANHHW